MTHACYLLRSLNPRFRTRFYIGCTMDPRRRLRQHNGEIGQGARRTKAMRPWEMALCVYGFPSHVEALKFEWAWQHPFESIAVREAAARLPSFKGVTGMVTLVCTMLTLPKWSSVNLTLQFMTSDLLQYRRGGPQLPPQMRVIVAPMQSLPGKDSTDGNDDDDNLNTCSEGLSQSQPWDEESGLDHAHDTAGQAASMTAGCVEGITSAAVKPKGKKGRKGKTPPGRKGKRGGNCRPSVDPILVELRAMGTDTRTSFAMTQGSCQGGSEITLDCDIRYETSPNRGVASGRDIESSVRKDSTMIATLGETSGSIETRTGAVCEASVDVSALSVRDRILLFRGFRTGAIEADLYFSDSDSENVGDFTASVEMAANETAYTYNDSEDRLFDSGQIPEGEVLGDSLWGKDISRVTSGDLSDCLENEPATRGDMLGMKTGGGHTVSGSCSGQGSFFSEDTSSGFHAGNTPSEMLPKDHHAAKSAASEVKTVFSAGAKFVPEENLAPKSRVESSLSHGLCDDQSDDGLEGASRILSSRRMGDRVGSERVLAGDSPSRYKTASSTGAGLAAIGAIGPRSGRPGEGHDSCGVARALPLCTEDGKALTGVRDKSQASDTPSIPNRDSILPASRGDHVTTPRQVTILSDSDVEEIGSEEFRPSSGNGASGTTYSDSSCHKSETGVNGKMFTESHCVGLHQKTLTDVFRVRKNRPQAQSIFRKARNGETCEVLKESSKGRNPPYAEQGFALSATATVQKCSEPRNDRTTKLNNAQKNFAAADNDDDDEIIEISAQEFQQPSSLVSFQSKRNVCTLRDVR